jgi:glycolate oxidase iron-sulfur subunit
MQTALAEFARTSSQGQTAEQILRTCVHCGFCNATCPTYQVLGNELDGPRGRIYMMKAMLEGEATTRATMLHLDRCLTCRNCETTCPSGVKYGELLEIGREMVEARIARPWPQRWARWLLRQIIPHRVRFTALLRLGQFVRFALPPALKRRIPAYQRAPTWPPRQHARTMLILEGCAQPALAPRINAVTARVLDRLGIGLVRASNEVCCGAASYHTSGQAEALDFARKNIDAWWPHVEAGAEAIVMTASGCGVFVKDYGHLLKDDSAYAFKAKRVSELTKDLSEVLTKEDVSKLTPAQPNLKVAFHSPCTLQHGQKLNGTVEKLLRQLGYRLTHVPDVHLCCGSAGTYSILQSKIAGELKKNKVEALVSGKPEVIATANIGCLTHLQSGSPMPVLHWVELVGV